MKEKIIGILENKISSDCQGVLNASEVADEILKAFEDRICNALKQAWGAGYDYRLGLDADCDENNHKL